MMENDKPKNTPSLVEELNANANGVLTGFQRFVLLRHLVRETSGSIMFTIVAIALTIGVISIRNTERSYIIILLIFIPIMLPFLYFIPTTFYFLWKLFLDLLTQEIDMIEAPVKKSRRRDVWLADMKLHYHQALPGKLQKKVAYRIYYLRHSKIILSYEQILLKPFDTTR